ncbi:MAG: hypothetical protein LBO67_03890 [Spirochaetaceae bacterium]|jgi:hypothetical protein|nr:hypothetical protein [Spirochaetaceae bacterium]
MSVYCFVIYDTAKNAATQAAVLIIFVLLNGAALRQAQKNVRSSLHFLIKYAFGFRVNVRSDL